MRSTRPGFQTSLICFRSGRICELRFFASLRMTLEMRFERFSRKTRIDANFQVHIIFLEWFMGNHTDMGLTLVEKIAARHADGLAPGTQARSGDFVSIRPRHVMTHDNTGAVIPKFKQIGATSIADPAQPVFAIDHDIQNTSPENLAKYAKIEAFARDHGIDFYPAGTGISHQVMVEQGYVVPSSMVVASDSHSNLYGAMAALGTPVVRTDAASIWATGVTWWQVPPVAKVVLKGKLSPGV